jgi:hypothetical protein
VRAFRPSHRATPLLCGVVQTLSASLPSICVVAPPGQHVPRSMAPFACCLSCFRARRSQLYPLYPVWRWRRPLTNPAHRPAPRASLQRTCPPFCLASLRPFHRSCPHTRFHCSIPSPAGALSPSSSIRFWPAHPPDSLTAAPGSTPQSAAASLLLPTFFVCSSPFCEPAFDKHPNRCQHGGQGEERSCGVSAQVGSVTVGDR